MTTLLEKLVEKYPDENWWWGEDGLNSNPSITPKFVEKYLNKPWNWGQEGYQLLKCLI